VTSKSVGDIALRTATGSKWLPHALAHFDEVLIDHAHCEKKAAANALSLLQAYPDVPGLPAQMARLAREESAHLAKVLQIMEKRGLVLGKDFGDPYAQGLLKLMRNPSVQRRLDRFLVAGIIEARSHERLALLASGLKEEPLRRFYAELAKSEDGHQRLFLRLAYAVGDAAEVEERLALFLDAEAKLVDSLPLRAAVH
jgi:tRNA 2-(methylsulfanyl)-N6-isopentenyladenosine37 hydroxylase